MAKIIASNGDEIIVDEKWLEMLSQVKWNIVGKSKYSNGYASHGAGKKICYMHRIITGEWRKDLTIDHINSNSLDNREDNLRICNFSSNIQRSPKNRKNKTSKYIGVHKVIVNKKINKTKWAAHASGKYLGIFGSEEDAAKIYNDYALKHHGEFARLNIIED